MAKLTKKQPWHAVSVVPGSGACADALALRGRRFLPPAAPRLPLVTCGNQAGCQCRFQHHADRRGEPRRTRDSNAPAPAGSERRRPGERRERR